MIFVYIESVNGQLKKSSLEVLTYGKKLSSQMGKDVAAICLSDCHASQVGEYGISKVYQVTDARFSNFDSKAYTKAIAEIFSANDGEILVLPFNQNGKESAKSNNLS